MGRYVDLYKVDFNELVDSLMKNKKINDKNTLEKILLEFGEKIGDTYILLNNEYYEEYNSYYNCFRLINKHFNLDGEITNYSLEVFMNLEKEMVCNQNEIEVAERLEI